MKNLPQAFRLLGVFVSTALFVVTAPSASAASTGTLAVSPVPVAAGAVELGRTVFTACTLENSGTAPLTITKATSTNAAIRLARPALPLTLAAGTTVACAVRFAPRTLGAATGTIALTSNATNPTVNLPVSGSGFGAIARVSHRYVGFGDVPSGTTKTVSETLTNVGNTSLRVFRASTTGTGFDSSGLTLPVSLAPSASVTFTTSFAPKTGGAVRGAIMVASNAIDRTVTIHLSGTGTSAGTLAVSPSTANLGSVTVGLSKAITATLQATGASVVVSAATTTNSEFSIGGMTFPATIAAGQSASYTLKFAPKSTGAASGTISFASNGVSAAAEAVSGTGIAAAVAQHAVDLKWAASTGAVGYNVYRGTASGGPYAKQSPSVDATTAYTDSTVQAGQTYFYVVTALNSSGVESTYSNQAQAVVPSP